MQNNAIDIAENQIELKYAQYMLKSNNKEDFYMASKVLYEKMATRMSNNRIS